MAKKDNINKLTNFLALSLSHKIGSIVNPEDIYSAKYKKESESYFVKAIELSFEENWNHSDKIIIKEKTRKKLRNELTRKTFLNNKKFDIMEQEIDIALRQLDLS